MTGFSNLEPTLGAKLAWLLVDEGRTRRADGLILRPGAPGTADGAGDLTVVDQRDPAPQCNDVIEAQDGCASRTAMVPVDHCIGSGARVREDRRPCGHVRGSQGTVSRKLGGMEGLRSRRRARYEIAIDGSVTGMSQRADCVAKVAKQAL
jgi:hypothetical protein